MTTSREARVAQGILLGFLALIVLPYFWAAALTPPGSVWGGLLFSADDQNVHLMWARQARDGAFFFRDLFTTEGLVSGERPLFFNLLPALMGWISRFTGLEVAFSYHIVRVAAAALALWQISRLAFAVTKGEEKWASARLWMLALFAFTTGAGFLASLLPTLNWLDWPQNPNLPLMPEAFFLLSAFAYPLNIASYGLLAYLFTQIIRGTNPFGAFVAALLLANIHTYDAIPFIVVAAIWALWQWKQQRGASVVAGAAIIGALVPVIYQVVVFRASEEFRIKALTVTAPPQIAETLLTFSPLLLLAVIGFIAARDLKARWLLLTWSLVTLALVYAPTSIFSFARKMIEGWQIPLVVLAGIGLWVVLERASRYKTVVGAAILLVLALSPLQTFIWIMNNAAENNASRWRALMPVLYLEAPQAGALRALDQASSPGAVLSLPLIGSYIPRATGKVAYLGHWAETLNFEAKLPQVKALYSGQMAPEAAKTWMQANRIRYILDSPFERTILGNNYDPTALGLKVIYQGGSGENQVTVYEVTN